MQSQFITDPSIGVMLPCNDIVEEYVDSVVEVSAVDTLPSMQAVEKEELEPLAIQIYDVLRKVLNVV